MTNEEAIKIISNYEVNGCGYCHQGGDEIEEAFDMAIEALEQKNGEWCHDCAEYDKEKHCCPHFMNVIQQTVEELKEQQSERKMGENDVI